MKKLLSSITMDEMSEINKQPKTKPLIGIIFDLKRLNRDETNQPPSYWYWRVDFFFYTEFIAHGGGQPYIISFDDKPSDYIGENFSVYIQISTDNYYAPFLSDLKIRNLNNVFYLFFKKYLKHFLYFISLSTQRDTKCPKKNA